MGGLAIVVGVGTACGGKVIFDSSAGGAFPGSTTSGASIATTIGATTSTGGCDPASHTLDASGFDVTCNVASDCMSAFLGNFCQTCRCPFGAISIMDQAKYQTEAAAKSVGAPPETCDCPASKVACIQGACVAMPP